MSQTHISMRSFPFKFKRKQRGDRHYALVCYAVGAYYYQPRLLPNVFSNIWLTGAGGGGDAEQEMQEQEKLRINLERVERAGVRADQPIDDSAVVDDMFGFLEDQKDTVSESQAPSAFR